MDSPARAIESAFPKFLDGDVYIIAGVQAWRLHSTNLGQASVYLKTLFTSPKVPKAKSSGIRYTLELGADKHGNPNSKLHLKDASKNTIPNFANLTAGKATDPVFKGLDNVFRMLYHLDLKISDSNVEACIQDCHAVAAAASIIGVQYLTGKVVEPYLLRLGRPFFESVALEPIAWANFALSVRAEEIFKDSVVHLVGIWRAMDRDHRAQLDDEVKKLVVAKVRLLDQNKQAIELRMVGHFPKTIHRAKESNRVRRAQYSNEIYWWISTVVFLQWAGQNLLAKRNYESEDGGYHFYTQIATAGDAFLNRDDLAHWHQYFPMTGTGAGALEGHVRCYKDEMKDFVEPLMVNRARYDPAVSGPLPYLTCCVVEKEDLPWYKGEKVDTIALGERKRPLETDDEYEEEQRPNKRRATGNSPAQDAVDGEQPLFFTN